ncbi:hypothetical protein FPRO06_04242 [Fusarium proliferatum]|nr:hypothetical protein FPRO06_04242 [Fusarium proliferatum]
MEQTTPTIGQSEDSRSELFENDTKSETVAESTPQPLSDANPASSNSPSHPPSTSAELNNMAAHTASKKKGTASTVKKTPKRSKKTGGPRAAKRAKPTRKAARIAQGEKSVFCSNEHAQTWWERMVSKLPKAKGKGGVNDQLTQEEFMALLQGGLSGTDEEGLWRLVRAPFAGQESNVTNGTDKENSDQMHLSAEEKEYLESAAAARFHLAEETVLCHKMLTLLEFAHERRQAAITAGRFKEDICGYDERLDSIGARDAFEAFAKSPEGEAIFKASRMSDPLGEGDEVRGMCERKRCKFHGGWYKMLSLGLKHQIREMATQADEVGEEEKAMRQAAKDRWRRKQSEKNWVEVLDG